MPVLPSGQIVFVQHQVTRRLFPGIFCAVRCPDDDVCCMVCILPGDRNVVRHMGLVIMDRDLPAAAELGNIRVEIHDIRRVIKGRYTALDLSVLVDGPGLLQVLVVSHHVPIAILVVIA